MGHRAPRAAPKPLGPPPKPGVGEALATFDERATQVLAQLDRIGAAIKVMQPVAPNDLLPPQRLSALARVQQAYVDGTYDADALDVHVGYVLAYGLEACPQLPWEPTSVLLGLQDTLGRPLLAERPALPPADASNRSTA